MPQQKQGDDRETEMGCMLYFRGVSARNSKHFLLADISLNSKNRVFIVPGFEKNKNSY